MSPELFAPGLVSTENLEIEGVFSHDMMEFYFVRQVLGVAPKLYRYQLENVEWTESISGDRTGEVFFSSDGQTMFLGKCMGCRKILSGMKAYVEYGIFLRDGIYKWSELD